MCVIGAGPGGYAAAFHAADRGLKVALIDAESKPGGVCLHRGCIPSKALLHAASLIEESELAANWGIHFERPRVDLDRLREWKGEVVERMVSGLAGLCRARGIEYIQGTAVFVDSERVAVEDASVAMVQFEHAILATGSSPAIPAALRIDSPRLMDSTAALELPDVPEKLLVIGGGYIGLELATVYAALGSAITVVEMTDGLLPGADRDLVRPLAARLKKSISSILLETAVTSISETKDGLEVTWEGKGGNATQTFDRALISVGRRPNTSGLGIENTAATLDENGFVRVNPARRTEDPRIYAIGDVAGQPMLAHKATAEAKVAAAAIAGEPAAFDPAAIPAVVFTDPEIAWTGLTETEAKEQGRKVKVARFPWGASGRAVTLDRTDGMTKLITDPANGLVLGVGIVGPGAGDLIAEGVLAIEMGAVAEDLAAVIHPHPTLSETVMESAELIFGSATHMHRPAKK